MCFNFLQAFVVLKLRSLASLTRHGQFCVYNLYLCSREAYLDWDDDASGLFLFFIPAEENERDDAEDEE